jgi:cold shock CspA family protein
MKWTKAVCAVAVLGVLSVPLLARAENSFTPGPIKSIDAAKKTIVIDKAGKDVTVKITEETTYKGVASFTELKVGQTVNCENQKTEKGRIAVNIAVTAEAPKAEPKPAEAKPDEKK